MGGVWSGSYSVLILILCSSSVQAGFCFGSGHALVVFQIIWLGSGYVVVCSGVALIIFKFGSGYIPFVFWLGSG